MLSSITTATLATMATSSTTSNRRPGRVSASKMIVYQRWRHPDSGWPSRWRLRAF
jgi:hypothetical protein